MLKNKSRNPLLFVGLLWIGTGLVAERANAAPAPPTVSISANPISVVSGSSSSLTWSSTDATSCEAHIGWAGTRATSGSASTGALVGTTVYLLICDGPGGSANQSVTVAVTATPPAPSVTVTATPTTVPSGASTSLSWSSLNAISCDASGAWSGRSEDVV